ncbi:MAG TPA: putative quinol monooxygenase [Bradyrhizobium sp.]|nr:putative quinol monooxygenase [Bradyrhizobium sp.]
MNPGITLVVVMKAKPEKAQQFERVCLDLVEKSRQDEGCEEYHLHRGKEDPNLFVYYESWTSEDHLDRHLRKPHTVCFRANQLEYLEKELEIIYLKMTSQYRP